MITLTFRDALAFRRHALNGIHLQHYRSCYFTISTNIIVRCVHAGNFQLLGEVLPFRTSLCKHVVPLQQEAIVARVLPITKLGPSLLASRCMTASRLQKGLPPEQLHPLRVLSGAPQQPHFVITSVFREAYVPRQHCASRWIRASGKLFLSRNQHCTAADSFPSPLGFSPPLSPPPYVRNLEPLVCSPPAHHTLIFCTLIVLRLVIAP